VIGQILPSTKQKGLKEPTLFYKNIKLSTEVKYSGLTLDKGLTWGVQLDRTTNRAHRAFWTSRGSFGKTWDLTPKVLYWLYTMVIGPKITYATIVL
jgi:hypothetical protein